MKYLMFLLIFLTPLSALAATGDILYQNCAGGPCTAKNGTIATFDSGNGWNRSVVTNGCYSGNCLKLNGTQNTNSAALAAGIYGAGSTSIGIGNSAINGKGEITISQWVKFSKSSISGANMKIFIPYVTSTSRWGVLIVPNYAAGRDIYLSSVKPNRFTKTSLFSPKISSAYSQGPDSNGEYWSDGRLIAGGVNSPLAKPGSTWFKLTAYLKLPATGTSNNGLFKLWMNDQLLFDAFDIGMDNADNVSNPDFHNLTFFSSSEAKEPFEHWMDEMIIYEGYVPPVPESGPIRSNPQPTSPLSSGTTSTNLQISTDVNATCRYSTTAGVSYASMPNSFTGAGTTSHTRTLTGLTNGSSTTYYVKCAKTSDGSSNATDYQINVSVLTPQYNLGVFKEGTGDGTVVSSPTRINCGSTCSENFNENASVVLTPTSSTGSSFDGWSGCDSVLGNQCTVNMTSNKTATATFNSATVTCDPEHFWLCTDGPCQALGAGYYFWGDDGEKACRTIPEPADWTGLNIAENGTFSQWTQQPSGTWLPSNWNSYTPDLVGQDLGACSILAGGGIYRALPEVKNYRYVLNARIIASDFEVWTDDQGSSYFSPLDGAVRTITGTASYDGDGDRNIYLQGHSIIDDVVIKELSASDPINGMCGGVSGSSVPTLDGYDLCHQGEAANLSETWPKIWDCLGYNGGTPDLGCTAYLLEVERKINAQGSYDFK